MKEIKVVRTDIASVTEALKWSEDGQIALNSAQFITILTPSNNSDTDSNPDERYSQRETPALDQGPNIIEAEYGFHHDEKFSQTAYASENNFTDLVWSPTGATARRGCLLAGLTTRGEVYVYEPQGNPPFAEWKIKYHINTQIISDIQMEVPLRAADAELLRFHSLAWTSAYPWNGSKWGTSFMVLGCENGQLVIYQHDDEGLRFMNKWDVSREMTGRWIVNIELSATKESNNGVEQTTSTKSSAGIVKGDHGDILIALQSETNDVVVHRAVFNEQATKLELRKSTQLLRPSRLRINSMRWFRHMATGYQVLAMYQLGYAHIFIFDHELQHKWSLKIPATFKCECSGIIIYSSTTGFSDIKALFASCRGDVFSAEVRFSGGDEEEPEIRASTETSRLASFISKRRDISDFENSEVDTIDFELYSSTPHPHGGYMAVVYSAFQGRKLRYPVLSEHVRRIAFICLEPKLEQLPVWSIMSGSSLCTWWEINALLNSSVPKSKRPETKAKLIEGLTQQVQGVYRQVGQMDSSDNLGKDLENALLHNEHFDRIRLLQHYGFDYHLVILHALATVTLKFVRRLGDLELTDIDRAVLQSYSHFVDDPSLQLSDTSSTSSGPITISGGFFKESFDFTTQNSETSIVSEQSQVVWPRCSITLLPLTTVNVLTCGGCGRKVAHTASLPEKAGKLVEVILDTLDVCIYCGGRYYERKS